MRSDAIGAHVGGWESARSAAPEGGAAPAEASAEAPAARAPSAAARATPAQRALAQRRTRLRVEQVGGPDVDPQRYLVADLQLERLARWHRGDEVRPRPRHALARRLLLLLLDDRGAGEGLRLDLEVGDGVGAEGLEQVESRRHDRQVGSRRRRVQVVGPHAHDRLAAVVGLDLRIAGEGLVRELEPLAADLERDLAVRGV